MFTMSPRSRGWIFWLFYSAMLLTCISGSGILNPEAGGGSSVCDHECAFLKASKCIFLQEPVFRCASDDVQFPPSVTALLNNLPVGLKTSILDGNFRVKNVEDLFKIPPSILNLIPVRMIQFNAENVSSYLHYYSQEPLIAEKLIDCLNSSSERKSFLEYLNGDKLSPKMEDVIGSAVSKWQKDKDWNFLQLVESNTTVLLHMPPQFLLSLGSKEASEFLFHLGSKLTSSPQGDITRVSRNVDQKFSKYIVKIWAMLTVRENPDKIWNKYNFVLPGLTLDESKKLEVDEFKPFLSYDLRAAQVRIIVSKLLVPWKVNFNQIAPWVKYLSSTQIQKFRRMDFDTIPINANETASIATAKQILLYRLLKRSNEKVESADMLNFNSSGDLLQLKDGFVSILPLKTIQQLCRSSVLTIQSLQKIDSNLLSLSAAYYLTDQGKIFNIEKPDIKITGIRGLLRAIPTSKIMALKTEMSSILLHHLLRHLQGDNILRNLELLKKCRPTLGSADHILKFLLENEDKNEYFSLLSPKDVAHISLETINSLNKDKYSRYIEELPPHILGAILSQNSIGSWTWNNMINSTDSFDSLLMGLNCNEMNKIEDSDFVSIIGHYNNNRMKMNKAFPKNLQRCGQYALGRYLRVKSQLYNEPDLIDLLEPSDVKAVGGYILASLSAEEILQAKHSDEIIAAIGQLSLPELLLAASHYHFSSLTDEFLNQDVKMADLLLLKNLIHFISVPNLAKIKPENLKYIIESDFIDKRLCANSEMRNAWSHLLISAFGLPSKWNASQLESLGDLMIALPPDQLDAISPSQWQILADIAVTKYVDRIEWPKSATFYQACLSTLVKSEQKSYIEAIKSLQRKYFEEVQQLVGSITVKYAEESFVLLKTNETSFVSYAKPKVISPDEDSNESDEESDESEEAEDENGIGGNSKESFSDLESGSEESNKHQSTSNKPTKPTTSKDERVFISSTSAPQKNLPLNKPTSVKPSEPERVMGRNFYSNVESSGQQRTSLDSNVKSSSQGFIATTVAVTFEPEQHWSNSTSPDSHADSSESQSTLTTGSASSEKEEEYSSKFATMVSSVSLSDTTITIDFTKASSAISTASISYLPMDVFSQEEQDEENQPEVYEPEKSLDNLGSSRDTWNAKESVIDDQILKHEGVRNSTSLSTGSPALQKKSLYQISEEIVSSVVPSTEVPDLSEVVKKFGSLFSLGGHKDIKDTPSASEVPLESKEASGKENRPSNMESLSTGSPALQKKSLDQISEEIVSSAVPSTEVPDLSEVVKKFGSLFSFGGHKDIKDTPSASEVPIESKEASGKENHPSNMESPSFGDVLFGGGITDFIKEQDKNNAGLMNLFGFNKNHEVASTDNVEMTSTLANDHESMSDDTSIIIISSTLEVPTIEISREKTTLVPTSASVIKKASFGDSTFVGLNLKAGNLESIDALSDDFNGDYKFPDAEIISAEENGHSSKNDGGLDMDQIDSAKWERFARSVTSAEIVSNLEEEEFLSPSKQKSDVPLSRHRRNAGPSLNRVFCDSVKILGPSATLAIQEADIHGTDNEELVDCVEDLGKLELPLYLREIIWQRVKSFDVIPMTVGTLAAAWKTDDVNNLSLDFNKDWNLEIIHLLSKHNMDSSVGKIIVDKIRKQIITNDTATFEVPEAVMVAMGPLLCYLSERELESMFRTSGTFMHVMPVISKTIKGCPMECLAKLSKLAVVFMDSSDSWTSDMVSLLGPLPAGLDIENWKLLINRPWAISGLQPAAAECLPQLSLQMMSPETMAILPPLTTKLLSDKQLILLQKEQKDILIAIRNERWSLRNSSIQRHPSLNKNSNVNTVTDLSSGCNVATTSIAVFVLSVVLFLVQF